GAYRVAADILSRKIGGDCPREADNGTLARAIDETVRHADDGGSNRRHVHDGAATRVDHRGNEGTAHAIGGSDIQLHREGPILFIAVEYRAVMDEARAVEEHIDRADLFCDAGNGFLVRHIK